VRRGPSGPARREIAASRKAAAERRMKSATRESMDLSVQPWWMVDGRMGSDRSIGWVCGGPAVGEKVGLEWGDAVTDQHTRCCHTG